MTSPLSLYLVGGRWLIGPSQVPRNVRFAEPGTTVFIDPVFEYMGDITANNTGGVSVRHGVAPISGLMSLINITCRPDAIVDLESLAVPEAKDIRTAYARCEDMVRTVRAEMAGIAAGPVSRIIVPGRVVRE